MGNIEFGFARVAAEPCRERGGIVARQRAGKRRIRGRVVAQRQCVLAQQRIGHFEAAAARLDNRIGIGAIAEAWA
jgi:hypothetical protein